MTVKRTPTTRRIIDCIYTNAVSGEFVRFDSITRDGLEGKKRKKKTIRLAWKLLLVNRRRHRVSVSTHLSSYIVI